MRHTITLYLGEYEIVTANDGTKYLSCLNTCRPVNYTFNTKADSKEFIRDIIELDLIDEDAIKEFLKKRGLPINTESSSEFPTYCGQMIPEDFAKKISPSSSGISMSLGLFQYTFRLIRNVLQLSTEISYFELKPLKSFETDFNKNLYIKEKSQLIQSFLSLLYQPYAMYSTAKEQLNWVLGGTTPLSKFAYHFHCVLLGLDYRFLFEDYILMYNHALEDLCKKNWDSYRKLNSDTFDSESDVPVFKAAKELILKMHVLEIPSSQSEILNSIDSNVFRDFLKDDSFIIKRILPSVLEIPDTVKPYEKLLDLSFTDADYSTVPGAKTEGNIICNLSNDSIHYKDLITLLLNIEKHFIIIYKDSEIFIKCKNIENIESISKLFNDAAEFGKKLIAENINIYISNINYLLSVEESGEYILEFKSNSLLQSIFFEIANYLGSYNASICKYPPCNKLVFSTRNKPASCCCHNHYTNYKGLLDRKSKKLFQ